MKELFELDWVEPNLDIVMKIIQKGVEPIIIQDLARDYGLTKEMMCQALGIPRQTYFAKAKKSESFSGPVTERILRFYRVYRLSELIHGHDKESIRNWMNVKDDEGFGGKCPLEMLQTEFGAIAVYDSLLQVIHERKVSHVL